MNTNRIIKFRGKIKEGHKNAGEWFYWELFTGFDKGIIDQKTVGQGLDVARRDLDEKLDVSSSGDNSPELLDSSGVRWEEEFDIIFPQATSESHLLDDYIDSDLSSEVKNFIRGLIKETLHDQILHIREKVFELNLEDSQAYKGAYPERMIAYQEKLLKLLEV